VINAEPNRLTSAVALAATVLLAAAALRFPALSSSPPGVWLDEAIGAVEGDALIRGERPPGAGSVRSPRWPVWSLVEGASAWVAGMSVPSARFPAAVAGLLSVALAFLVARRFGTMTAGLAAAAFLAASYWHVSCSRMALPCILVVPETLFVGWLLLRDKPLSPGAGVLLVLVCAAAPLGYAASLVTPVLAAGLLVLRVRTRGARATRTELVVLASTAVAVTLVLVTGPDSLHRSSALGRLGTAGPAGWLHQTGRVLANWAVGERAAWGCWNPFPAGSPRTTAVELTLVLLGTAAFARSSIPRERRIALAGWCALALLPEIAPGDSVNLLRGLPALAPAAVLAGLGAETVIRLTGRPGAFLLAGAVVLNAGRTAWLTFRVLPRDPSARSWYLVPDQEAADCVRSLAAREPVILTPVPTRTASPVLLFHLRASLRRGLIRGSDVALSHPRLDRVFRTPQTGEPVLFVFRDPKRQAGRVHLGLLSIDGLLAFGRDDLRAGRTRNAEAHFRGVLALVPDSAVAHGALGLALAAQGRWHEAADHLRIARPFSAPGSPCALALAEAERRI